MEIVYMSQKVRITERVLVLWNVQKNKGLTYASVKKKDVTADCRSQKSSEKQPCPLLRNALCRLEP